MAAISLGNYANFMVVRMHLNQISCLYPTTPQIYKRIDDKLLIDLFSKYPLRLINNLIKWDGFLDMAFLECLGCTRCCIAIQCSMQLLVHQPRDIIILPTPKT